MARKDPGVLYEDGPRASPRSAESGPIARGRQGKGREGKKGEGGWGKTPPGRGQQPSREIFGWKEVLELFPPAEKLWLILIEHFLFHFLPLVLELATALICLKY